MRASTHGAAGATNLVFDDAKLNFLKARDADVFLFTRQTYVDFPNYYLANATFGSDKQLTDANPQQRQFAWSPGAKLIDYTSAKGDKLQGALYLPANYQPGKKYPLLVTIYEKRSQNMHAYAAPNETRAPNPTLFTSKGYAVLDPDIVYKLNDPGMSAVWSVVPAVKAAIATGIVDSANVGLWGHSWGGYQTAFLVTQTNIFKSAIAGAPLTDMVSMYSSIYWNTGGTNQGDLRVEPGTLQGQLHRQHRRVHPQLAGLPREEREDAAHHPAQRQGWRGGLQSGHHVLQHAAPARQGSHHARVRRRESRPRASGQPEGLRDAHGRVVRPLPRGRAGTGLDEGRHSAPPHGGASRGGKPGGKRTGRGSRDTPSKLSQDVGPRGGVSGPRLTPAAGEKNNPPRRAPLDILILGGTGFTGPEQVEYATARGHRVTLLNRNKTRPDFFKGRVEQLVGDLNDDVTALKGRKFDVVIDNPTTLPAWVRNAAQYLAGNTKHYIFISTISVYPDNSIPGQDETAATTPMPADLDPYTLDRANAGKYYGALKTFSEKEVAKHYPGINTIIRPGLIVGPLDRTDRFTYWPYRIDKGGEGARARQSQRSRAVHRLARPRRVDDSHGGESRLRHVSGDRSRSAAHHRRDAVRHQGGHDGRRAVHVGAGRLSRRAEDPRLARHDGMGAVHWSDGGLHAPQQREGRRRGAHLPSARRHGEGHARLEQDAARR